MTIETVQQADYEQNVTHRENVAPGGKHESAFRVKLRGNLAKMGIDMERLDYRTEPGRSPPCFEIRGASYRDWEDTAHAAACASNELSIPIRLDLPAEPNYCHDCTADFKNRALKTGSCLFPNTKFEVRTALGEKETVGVSRSRETPPERHIVYQNITVPVDALHDSLKKYVYTRKVQRLNRLPKGVKKRIEESLNGNP
jgi:hypothetical protein